MPFRHRNRITRSAGIALAAGFLLALPACDSENRPDADKVIEPIEDAFDDLGDAADDVIDKLDDATKP